MDFKLEGNLLDDSKLKTWVIGPEMPSAELLAAAAKLTEAQAELREAELEEDTEIFIGPPPPAVVAEAESANEAERFEEIDVCMSPHVCCKVGCPRVIGPEMPSAELLAAAAKLTEAQAELREAELEEDTEIFIGPPPPAVVAEAESANEAERFEEDRHWGKYYENYAICVTRIMEADADCLYDVLGVNHNMSADNIKKRYWKLSLLVHPDKCPHPQAHQAFIKLNKSFKELQDPDKRKAMDEKIKLKEEQEAFKAELKSMREAAQWRRLQGISMEGDDELLADMDVKVAPKRDEWMTTLPPERKPGMTTQSTTFSKSSKAGRGDTSVWTDTPSERAQKAKMNYLEAYNEAAALATNEVQKSSDADLVDKYNKGKRSKSLVQKHQEEATSRSKKKTKVQPEKQEWVGQHPWKPWDRDKDLAAGRKNINLDSENMAEGLTSRVIGPEMPSAELLAAAAKLTEAQAELREAELEEDTEIFIGPPPPAVVAEAESANEAERFEEVTRIMEADADCLYDVLGVNHNMSADNIKKRYWKLSLLVHPDKCPHPQAHQAFIKLNKSFKELQDPDKRKAMDEKIKLKEEQEAFKAELKSMREAAQWRRLQGISMEGDDELLADMDVKVAPKRDEWMTTLPPERKPGMTTQSTTFSKSSKAGRGDTSVWTDTPSERAQKAKMNYLEAYNEAAALATNEVQKSSDADLVDKYNKGKRSKSLVQKHQEEATSRSKKKTKVQPEKQEWVGQHPWKPWDRDKDLAAGRKNINLDSENMAEGLTSRFSSGNFQRNFL
nr:isoform 3 of gpalpp motifs-containing protein 1 [Quercus suber]